MNNGLNYSEEALMNRVLFLSKGNDINIFVEDQDKQYIYESIFERMFEQRISVKNIFPMNGKKGVEKAFSEYGTSYQNIPAIYLVDGDFDVILDKSMIIDDHYIYLFKYNIECYYIDKKAVIKFMAGVMKKTQKEVDAVIDFDKWKTETEEAFFRLFLNYVIAKYKFPNEKNVGKSPFNYTDETGTINTEMIVKYEEELRDRIEDYQELYDLFFNRFVKELGAEKSRLICGKYMLASLQKYLLYTSGLGIKQDNLIYSLCNFFDIHKLDYVKKAIEKVID